MAHERILLVEDNETLRTGLRAILEQENYQVDEAGNGVEALKLMEINTPDLILADIMMPEMDGYAFFAEVRKRQEWVAIPFIFLTARRERKFILAGKRLGAEDYLVKPITPEDLRTAIRSRLSRSQQLLLVQLREAYEASLVMFANAIEVRDPYTRGHVERVMNYSHAIAEGLNWSPTSIESLRFGSILHDIGKIHIAESILKKRGPLTDAEWEEMRNHPQMGVDLVKDIPYLVPAIPVILYHHERWNGSGYPFGMRGEEIPVAARVVAVADSFDAMTTMRPYRSELTPLKAYQEIMNARGVLYDPVIVDAFHRAWEENQIAEIYQSFP